MTKNEIIERLKKVFKNKNYDYSLISDTKTKNNIYLICPTHGKFKKRLERALNGSGCPKCSGKIKKTFEQFKEEATKIHNGKYLYNDSNYVNSHTNITITCPVHGEFKQTPTNHLNGNGCPKCKIEKLAEKNSSCIEEFIDKANIVHNSKYDYSKSVYINNRTPTLISCPIHGEFWQTPQGHLSGRGCPYCRESKLEKEIKTFLEENKIDFKYQWHLPWAKYYSLDFYLPQYNIGIECQGIQHFEERFKKQTLKQVQERDKYKFESCMENGITILYYSNIEGHNCITNKKLLLEAIKKGVE